MRKFFTRAAALLTAAASISLCSFTALAEVEPNPVISRNVPVYSNSGQPTAANDEHYFSFCYVSTPGYVAYDLSDVPDEQKKQVIAVWYNPSAYDDIGMYRNRNMEPSDYTVEVNSAPGGEYPEEGWEVVETVSGNTLSSRQHLVSMEGYNWIRLNIAMANDSAGTQASFNFDVHTVSGGVSDSWLFLGDSITAGGMNNCYGTGFATHVNMLDDRYFPIQENGGIGGIKSSDGKENIDRWLSVSQAKYVSIAYGTNDCWGNPNATEEYRSNTEYMIDAVLAAGKTPVLPKIPASVNADVMDNVPLYNAVIDEIYEKYGDRLVQGPDFQTMFEENPDFLSGDGVHPSDTGYAAMRETWAKTMYEKVYTAEAAPVTTAANTTALTTTTANTNTTVTDTGSDIVYGDANDDGAVDIADATKILQYIGNGDKYPLTEQGAKNADCCDPGKGITALDALAVQKLDAHVLSALPEISS